MNAIDYLLKPIRRARLHDALNRARTRLEHRDLRAEETARLHAAAAQYEAAKAPFIERIPVRRRDDILIVPVREIASLVADGELLQITTVKNERHAITFALREMEARLDPARFLRLSRGALANVDLITRVSVMPGGGHVVTLANGQQIPVSRQQSRVLRSQLLRL